MMITIEVKTSRDCMHREHSGALTPGRAKDICGHPYAIPSIMGYDEKVAKAKDSWDWNYRVLGKSLRIPAWCPMKNDYKYQMSGSTEVFVGGQYDE
jgi:hypothetical protein